MLYAASRIVPAALAGGTGRPNRMSAAGLSRAAGCSEVTPGVICPQTNASRSRQQRKDFGVGGIGVG